jgi:hypothetical protein
MLFAGEQRPVQTTLDDGATCADLFGCALLPLQRRTAIVIFIEEQFGVVALTGSAPRPVRIALPSQKFESHDLQVIL